MVDRRETERSRNGNIQTNGGEASPSLAFFFMVPKLFIQSQNIFVGSLQNETNQKFKQSQEVTVKTLQLFIELVFYINSKYDRVYSLL